MLILDKLFPIYYFQIDSWNKSCPLFHNSVTVTFFEKNCVSRCSFTLFAYAQNCYLLYELILIMTRSHVALWILCSLLYSNSVGKNTFLVNLPVTKHVTFSKWGLMAVRVTGMIGTGMVCTVGQKFWSIDLFYWLQRLQYKKSSICHHIYELLKLKKECWELFLLIFSYQFLHLGKSEFKSICPKGKWIENLISIPENRYAH